jgi:hypothetical protein
MLPDGPASASPRACARGPFRRSSTSFRRRPARRSSSSRRTPLAKRADVDGWRSAVNFSFFLSLAVRRTRSRPWDAPARLRVRSAPSCSAFPSVPALGSTGSSPGRPASFVGFAAPVAGSDFSCPFVIGYGSSPSRRGPQRRQAARPDMRPLRFRRCLFARDGVFDLGGASASRIATPHMLPSTILNVSAPTTLEISRLNSPPHAMVVYASQPPSPTTTQHSLPGVRYDLPGPDFPARQSQLASDAQGRSSLRRTGAPAGDSFEAVSRRLTSSSRWAAAGTFMRSGAAARRWATQDEVRSVLCIPGSPHR